MLAFSLIVTEAGHVETVLAALHAMPQVLTASPTGRPYDLIARVATDSMRELQRVVERLVVMSEVRSVTTLVATDSATEGADGVEG